MQDKMKKENNNTNSNEKYIPPEYDKSAFHCPHCRVLAHQEWLEIFLYRKHRLRDILNHLTQRSYEDIEKTFKEFHPKYIDFAFCNYCKKYSIWVNLQMVTLICQQHQCPLMRCLNL